MKELPFYGIGNLTDDPDVRVTPNGNAVANLTIAIAARRYDRQSRAWVDGDTSYVKLVVWNEQAQTWWHAAPTTEARSMTNLAKSARRLYEKAAQDTICCRCDERIRAGEPIVWLKGLRAPGQAHLRCGPAPRYSTYRSVGPG